MPLIKCTHCGATGNAPEHILGQQVRCSKCKKSFVAATEDEEPAEDEAADEPEEEEEEQEEDEEGELPSGSAISSRAGQRKPRREEPEDEDDEEEDDDEDLDVAPKRRIRRPSGGGFGEILTFRKFVGPIFIQIYFWLVLAVILGASLFAIAMSAQAGGLAIVFALVMAVIYVVVGTIFLRLVTELMMVMFRVYEVLIEIRDDLRHKD